MQRLRDAAEMLFEPTGDLWKDYSAYCEIEDKAERDDIVDAIHVVELKAPEAAASAKDAPTPTAAAAATGSSKVQTHVIARNLDYCLAKKDAMPLANAIPHCHTLTKLHLTGCGITEHSLKLFVEAAYKSPSLVSVAVDFNPGSLYKDPTVGKKDKNEVFVHPSQYRGNNQRAGQEDAAADKKGKAADKGKDKKAPAAAAPSAADEQTQQPIALPTGWHALLLTGIQQLSLRGNNITDRQVEPLAALLEQNTELLSLSLWGNSITSAGAAQLAKALKSNRRLTSLNLGHNQIDDEGVQALASVFLSADVSNEDASKLRARTLRGNPTAAELPTLPTYNDLFVAPGQADEKKDKKKDAGKKGKADGPAEKLRGEFDRDCVRIDEARVRVPGNTALWAINLSNNMRITAAGVDAVSKVLAMREPSYESSGGFDGTLPPHFCSPFLAVERVDVAHTALDADAAQRLKAQLDDFAQYRAAAAARLSSAAA